MIAAVGQNSAEINWEYALIERLDEHDLSTRLISFNLVNSIDNRASADNQLLKPETWLPSSPGRILNCRSKSTPPSSAWAEKSMRPGCTASIPARH